MNYPVVLTDRAEADLDRLLRALSPDRASRLAARFWTAVGRLETAPLSCGLAYENRWFAEELRHLLFGIHPKRKHRALFVVREDMVVILTIRAPGQRPVTPEDVGD